MGLFDKLFGKRKKEIHLWLRNMDDANNRELLTALLIKENAPDWVAKKALLGDYRIEPDPQRGGCVVIFTH